MNNTHIPDRWVIVELKSPTQTIHKILASWYGGYLGSDSWKLSSAIVSVKELADSRYDFYNHSGSLYQCYRAAYGMTGYAHSVYAGLENKNTPECSISLIDEKEIADIIKKYATIQ